MSDKQLLSWRDYERLILERRKLRREMAEYGLLGAYRSVRRLQERLAIVQDMIRTADDGYRRAALANAGA